MYDVTVQPAKIYHIFTAVSHIEFKWPWNFHAKGIVYEMEFWTLMIITPFFDYLVF